jgi:uncharacterized membrane protein YkoI
MTIARLLIAALALALLTAPLQAARHGHYPILVAQRDQGGNAGISLDEAVAQARQQHNGKVLSAETLRVDGRKVYRIKILTKNGRVKRTQIDARSGRTESRGR